MGHLIFDLPCFVAVLAMELEVFREFGEVFRGAAVPDQKQ